LDKSGAVPLFIVIGVFVAAIGIITVYSTMVEPVEEVKDYVTERMDEHTQPIETYWTVFKYAGIFLFGAVLLWAWMEFQEDEYERSRRRNPRARY
jgi:hypothetical protein